MLPKNIITGSFPKHKFLHVLCKVFLDTGNMKPITLLFSI